MFSILLFSITVAIGGTFVVVRRKRKASTSPIR